jgi:hypothetical protein
MTYQQGDSDVKRRELDFTKLPNSALKCVLLIVAINSTGTVLTYTEDCHEENTVTILRIATVSSLNLRAACLRWASQSAVHLRTVCQGANPVVANRGIGARSLAWEWIPVPAILHRPFLILLSHKFLTRAFPGVRQIRGGLYRPKLFIPGLGWHAISWYNPLNDQI